MNSRIYGYIRVSTKEQNTGRQLEALTTHGVDERYIFTDKESGKDFNRTQYMILRNALRENDVLVIKSIDRLGRNYNEILKEWQYITKTIKADIKVIDMPLLDTTKDTKNGLTDTFIADLVLQILSYVAEQERTNIKQRQAEGIARAKAEGKHLGRPKTEYPKEFGIVYRQWKNGEITGLKAMNVLSLKRGTFYNLAKKYEQEQ